MILGYLTKASLIPKGYIFDITAIFGTLHDVLMRVGAGYPDFGYILPLFLYRDDLHKFRQAGLFSPVIIAIIIQTENIILMVAFRFFSENFRTATISRLS
jgi:hypothetical protein